MLWYWPYLKGTGPGGLLQHWRIWFWNRERSSYWIRCVSVSPERFMPFPIMGYFSDQLVSMELVLVGFQAFPEESRFNFTAFTTYNEPWLNYNSTVSDKRSNFSLFPFLGVFWSISYYDTFSEVLREQMSVPPPPPFQENNNEIKDPFFTSIV